MSGWRRAHAGRASGARTGLFTRITPFPALAGTTRSVALLFLAPFFNARVPDGRVASAAACPLTPHIAPPQVRLENDTLDSSPFPITLELSEELWADLEAIVGRMPAAGATSLSEQDSCRRMAQLVTSFVHCEVVFPDGRQVTLYSRDVPHAVPIPVLEVAAISASRRTRSVTIGVQRSLPLSSAHGNSEFRIAILFNPPRFGAAVLYTGVFRVLAKMGRRGTRPKQQHFASYAQLHVDRARKVLLLAALSVTHRHELERSLDGPRAVAVPPQLLSRCMREEEDRPSPRTPPPRRPRDPRTRPPPRLRRRAAAQGGRARPGGLAGRDRSRGRDAARGAGPPGLRALGQPRRAPAGSRRRRARGWRLGRRRE